MSNGDGVLNGVKDMMVGRTDSERVVVMFVPASPQVGDAEWALTLAEAGWLRDRLDEHSEAAAVHMIEDCHDRLDIDEPAPQVPGESGGEGGESV